MRHNNNKVKVNVNVNVNINDNDNKDDDDDGDDAHKSITFFIIRTAKCGLSKRWRGTDCTAIHYIAVNIVLVVGSGVYRVAAAV